MHFSLAILYLSAFKKKTTLLKMLMLTVFRNTVCRPVVSASTIHPSVCVSMSGKFQCPVTRQNPLGYKQHLCDSCRPTTRSPVDFRY